jgi:hypothetical protein
MEPAGFFKNKIDFYYIIKIIKIFQVPRKSKICFYKTLREVIPQEFFKNKIY